MNVIAILLVMTALLLAITLPIVVSWKVVSWLFKAAYYAILAMISLTILVIIL